MQQYSLSLTTLTNVLISSGKSATLIDTDIEFHKTGFPFIRARTLKGLLKESMQEVCEIENLGKQKTDEILKALFGEGGTDKNTAMLCFDNLYLPNWATLKKEVQHAGIASSQILKEYTTTIQQTAIDQNEIAKDTSLRNYRVLKPNLIFEGVLETTGMQYAAFLDKAILNLRYAGTRRNRGFGRIRLSATAIETQEKKYEPLKITDQSSLSIKVTTMHPVVLGLKFGDQNTVNTQTYLSGNQLRGLIIGMYLKKRGSFDDREFFDLFISGKLKFNYAFLNNSKPVPLNIHYKKSNNISGRHPINVFLTDGEITRPFGGMVTESPSGFVKEIPSTTLFFHNSREDRTAGKSTEDQQIGGIFYYEALDEDQQFEGSIEGDTALLKTLTLYLPAYFETHIGKSRSAQYGKVSVDITPVSKNKKSVSVTPGKLYIVKLETPLILFNRNGFPECTQYAFSNALGNKIKIEKILDAATGFVKIEQYNQSWQSKSGKMDAYKEGSVFIVKSSTNTEIEQEFYLGEWNEQGYGKCSIEEYNDAKKYEFSEIFPSKNIGAFSASHPEILEMQKKAGEAAKLLQVKVNALKLVKNYSGLNNHLVGRLIFAFETQTTDLLFNQFIAELKNKPAGKALKKYKLCNPEGIFKLDAIAGADSYALQKQGWLLLLQTIRKNNKKAKSNE